MEQQKSFTLQMYRSCLEDIGQHEDLNLLETYIGICNQAVKNTLQELVLQIQLHLQNILPKSLVIFSSELLTSFQDLNISVPSNEVILPTIDITSFKTTENPIIKKNDVSTFRNVEHCTRRANFFNLPLGKKCWMESVVSNTQHKVNVDDGVDQWKKLSDETFLAWKNQLKDSIIQPAQANIQEWQKVIYSFADQVTEILNSKIKELEANQNPVQQKLELLEKLNTSVLETIKQMKDRTSSGSIVDCWINITAKQCSSQ